jgi:hypothetical protein
MRNRLPAALFLALALTQTRAAGPVFYADDPIAKFPEPADAAKVEVLEASQGFDFVENTLMRPGDREDRPAGNVNTIDEAPDSSWFTNRIGTRRMTIDELVRGPNTVDGPAPGPWKVVRGDATGITPGFRINDARGDLYFIKVDPPRHLEMATGAEVVSTKIFHALGYNVPQNFVVTIRPEQLDIGKAETTMPDGRRRPMTADDLDRLLAKAARSPDGSYRVHASRALSGKPIGPFRYYGTRADDPNDIVPHEHRRELRGLRVFAAWVNHMDSRGINSLDTLVDTPNGKRVKHHLLDFGSTLGSAAIARKSRRSGNEYIWDVGKMWMRIFTLGLVVPGWTLIDFPEDLPAVGGFESDYFDPPRWVPHYPNAAFDNARAEDLFWGARRVAAFSNDAIRAVVEQGRYSDPRTVEFLTKALIERRDKIARAWLTAVNPLVDFSLSADGTVTFANAAVDAGVATPPAEYRTRWGTFDNATGEVSVLLTGGVTAGTTGTATTRMEGPASVLAKGDFIRLEIETVHPQHAAWAKPVKVTFRRIARGWRTVGLERTTR